MVKTGKDILNHFSAIFPNFMFDIDYWKKVSEESILIHKRRGVEYVFTYKSKENWLFETINSYNERVLET